MRRPDARVDGPLPRGIRLAAVVCLVLSAFTGFFALSECVGLGALDESRSSASTPPPLALLGNPEQDAHIAQAQLSALRSLRGSRAFILGALSVLCSLSFVSAGRLLRPDGLSPERMRRMLVGSTLAAGLLRTLDGAQSAAVARRMAPVIIDAMKTLPEFQGPPEASLEVVGWLLPATSMAVTALIAGAFVVLGQYFQSERVRLAISLRDEHFAPED